MKNYEAIDVQVIALNSADVLTTSDEQLDTGEWV